MVRAFLDQKNAHFASSHGETLLGMRQHRDDLLACDAFEPIDKIVDAGSVLHVFKQGPDGNTAALENPRASETLWIPFDRFA
jgi:hypothetical protein